MRHTITRAILLALLLIAVPVTAQDAKPAPLTEIESLRVQNVNLKVAILRDEIAHLKADLEHSRPGWIWNPDTGEWAAVKPPTGGMVQ